MFFSRQIPFFAKTTRYLACLKRCSSAQGGSSRKPGWERLIRRRFGKWRKPLLPYNEIARTSEHNDTTKTLINGGPMWKKIRFVVFLLGLLAMVVGGLQLTSNMAYAAGGTGPPGDCFTIQGCPNGVCGDDWTYCRTFCGEYGWLDRTCAKPLCWDDC